MLDVSIGIVTYNSADEIGQLLDSLFSNTTGLTFQVTVVDNASSDNTVSLVREYYPQVTVIESENRGFGHGHNHLLNVQSRYHLVCNPDIVLTENVIGELVAYMDAHEDCALVTPRVMGDDGREQHLPKRRPTARYMVLGRLANYLPVFKRVRDDYTMSRTVFDKPTEIAFCTGCFMLMRTAYWKEAGGFDEQFFMYLEDADLTDRIAAFGKVIFYPGAFVVHHWERGSAKSLKLLRIHLQSMHKYLKKRRQCRETGGR